MKLAELETREDALSVLAQTLQQGWSEQRGAQVRVLARRGAGQQWYTQRVVGGCLVDGAAPSVRQFLRESLQYTPRRHRLLPQYAAAQVLSSELALRTLARPAFAVEPALDKAQHLLVLPGNRRVRVLDFAQQTCRVLLKHGYAADSMQRDIAIRGDGRSGPFVPITCHAADGRWFDEPLWDGYPLPRCPPWWSQRALLDKVLHKHERWLDQHAQQVDARTHVDELSFRVGEQWSRLVAATEALRKYPVADWCKILGEAAAVEPRLCLSQSHGDLQPGNILVDRLGRHVTLIDWEHSKPRSYHYDHLVLGLPSRPQRDLARDAIRFIEGTHDSPVFARLPRDRDWRRRVLAVFLLEELDWFVAEAADLASHSLPWGLLLLLRSLRGLIHLFDRH